METLRAAVIGTGNMGKNHVRVYSELPGVKLVGVSDVNVESAQTLAKQHGCSAYKDYKDMLATEKPDVVSVVVPTALHAKIGCDVLTKASALVEKPIAFNEKDGNALIKASRGGHKLMVGHIERFNPVVKYLQDFAAKDEFLAFNIMRLGPYIPKVRTTGVLLDMGIHDIDLVRYLTQSEPVFVSASYRHVKITDFEDHAHVFMRMPSCDASLISNWISPRKIRHMYAVTQKSFYYVDYVTQEITAYEREEGYDPWKEGGEAKRIALEKKEPLKEELTDWLDAIRKGKPAPITGEDAFESLKVALRATRVAYESDPNE